MMNAECRMEPAASLSFNASLSGKRKYKRREILPFWFPLAPALF
jgi:hypothetical protein